MFLNNLTLFARIAYPLAASVLAYIFWRYMRSRHCCQGREDRLLVVSYIASRLGLWLVFAIYLQRYSVSSDARLFYKPMLDHFLTGDVPIREFFYPYGPFLIPSMLPLYLLLGRSLAGISLFAIFAEVVALGFFLKSTSLLAQRGEIKHMWAREALAVYLLNPGTLYWTVFQGYHSITQTAYSMGAFYFLLRGHTTIGYTVGFYGVAGSKFLAVLDWPALLAVRRPRLAKLLWGAIPLLITYVIFHIITGDIFFPLRYHIGVISEGNVWYLLTLFGDLRGFYAAFPGNLLPLCSFGILFLLGFVHWLRYLRLDRTSFSFQAAMGITTFTMSLFFLFSLYTANFYIPMLMLPASLVVTCPALSSRYTVWSLLLISGFCVAGDAMWTALGQPNVLVDAFATDSLREQWFVGFWIVSMLVRMACFAVLAQLGLRAATTKPSQFPLSCGQ